MSYTSEQIQTVNRNPLYQTIGLKMIAADNGEARSRLEPEPEICWPFPGQPHGGILFTQMDTTMAWAVLSCAQKDKNCSTINLEIQYPAPAKGTVFTCETRVFHSTGRSCFLRGETRDEKGTLVAMGQATFRIINVPPILKQSR